MPFEPETMLNGNGGNDTELALVSLFETCYDRVARYIALRIGRTHEADDLASEVFVRALRGAANYRDTGKPLEAWLFRIAHNISIDYLRKRDRRPRHVQLDEVYDIESGDSVHADLERDIELSELRTAIEQLPPAQREVVNLRFGAGLRPDEIAVAIGKKSTTVRWLQHAAIERLRTIMRPANGAEHANGAAPVTHIGKANGSSPSG